MVDSELMKQTLLQEHLNKVNWLSKHMHDRVLSFRLHYDHNNMHSAIQQLEDIQKALTELRQSLFVISNLDQTIA